LDDDHVAAVQAVLTDRHHWHGQKVSTLTKLGHRPQQPVIDPEVGRRAVVVNADEKHARSPVVGQVVRERADDFLDLVRVGRGRFSLDPVALR
jgi:hypothetical protein